MFGTMRRIFTRRYFWLGVVPGLRLFPSSTFFETELAFVVVTTLPLSFSALGSKQLSSPSLFSPPFFSSLLRGRSVANVSLVLSFPVWLSSDRLEHFEVFPPFLKPFLPKTQPTVFTISSWPNALFFPFLPFVIFLGRSQRPLTVFSSKFLEFPVLLSSLFFSLSLRKINVPRRIFGRLRLYIFPCCP